MSDAKYLFIYRQPADARDDELSPAEMAEMLAQWSAWKARFDEEIVDLGDGLKPQGRQVRAGAGGEIVVTDGAFVEAKEVLGGYSIVQAASLERAVEISRGCPVLRFPGSWIEVRELAGF
ncbi:YciI family protein [Ideonella sp. DXS22W]|uniref:YciI family protein n=1 Tax=Pseudaquabacterium inlustre TaxID=2984192 RepID=A0ABU9CHW6_9BURK